VDQCLELGIGPGDEYQSFVADGHITLIKKKPSAAEAVLKHIVASEAFILSTL
jgi:hypothetical protein